jgi:two-component system, OmpR family, response regulator
MRVLVVEDEPAIARDIESVLSETGYVVDIATDGEEGWFRASTEAYDAVILDLGLPKLDGLSVLKRLRDDACLVPILVLTARGAWLQRVEGIDAGADDYLTKPFEMEELLARLAGLLRRVGRHVTPVIEIGPLLIDTRRMRVLMNGRATELSPLEFRLLRYLAHNRDRVVSQSELVEHVYGNDEPESNAVEALVARLRRKIGHGVIGTRRGHGYILESQLP